MTNGCPAGGGLVFPYTCTPIELWFNNFVVPSVQGRVVAELNAYSGSKLFQDVCLVDGESFDFNFAHRGRGGADTAQFQVGASSSVILDVTTGTSGTGTINASAASSSNATGIAGGWTRYSGNYTYSGLSGIQSLGFAAVSTFGGSLGAGNVLDDINITLKPFIEFRSASSTGAERNPITGPSIKVTGLVPSTGLTITLTVGGNANFGSDFDFTGATTLAGVIGNSSSLTVTIPAGNYDDAQGNNTFVLPLRIIDDQMIESNETVTFDLPANSPTAAFVVSRTTTCGGAANTRLTHTILEDDNRIDSVKAVGVPQSVGFGRYEVPYVIVAGNAVIGNPTVSTSKSMTIYGSRIR